MRNNTDFSPFYRSSIGFDRIFNLIPNGRQSYKGGDFKFCGISAVAVKDFLTDLRPASPL
jgi:HSP20 family molecular chaperone IbpA